MQHLQCSMDGNARKIPPKRKEAVKLAQYISGFDAADVSRVAAE
jgi:hypothetical protein